MNPAPGRRRPKPALLIASCFLAFVLGFPMVSDAQAGESPRLGKYLIMSYGAPSRPPLNLGYFELLAGGSYRVLDMGGNATGEGRYDYDGQTNQVRWIDGPFLANKWGGKFEISREGKTHNIRFTRGTFGTNSTDSK